MNVSDWTEYSIDEIKGLSPASLAIGPFGSRMKSDTYVASGIPVIRGNNISDTKALAGKFVYISPEMADQLASCNVYDSDLVFPHRGAIGEVGIITGGAESHYMLSTSLMKLSLNKELAEPLFLFYFFRSPQGRHELLKNASTVGTPGIATPLTSLRSIRVHLPPLPEQRAIASILSALDDKIELNRRMNQTLEQMAQALFKSWFVDFDPVHANRDGEAMRGLAPNVQALFPAAFENSALGEIPQGWRVSQIGDHVQVVGGSTPSTQEPAYWDDGSIHWATPKDLSNLNDPVLLQTERRITEAGLAQISSGLLPRGTVLLSSRAPIGYLVIAEIPVAINQGFIAMKCDEPMRHYVRHWIRTNMDTIIGRANGTTFLEISKANFRPLLILLPEQRVLKEFQVQAQLWHEKIVQTLEETQTLTATRDTLLPKLLSGEVRVRKAEKMVDDLV